ncbi:MULTISPECIES: ATP-binding cassette domain-containing protein [Lactiplantibacillus]|uniref:ABC transporter ATP-binding protein n=1 Tax=Lactiplantibacillus argentoratensis TaxID=271881 RepID=A0ABS5UED9_9LACO|nr:MULTISPECIES: ATP-binding cassette domain-containing protein [Lactiplantibacillus]MCS6092574.1 ABC transporter ATP-binding protein [Lactobacillus sp. LMY-20]AOG32353.1 oligopeptide transport ATP-binding protein oppF [Lactiplantibacillus plantarum]AYC72857.1 ABC transporter ATP-binding protein [Lactiplantibacillus plantarum]MBT1136924.1 ABC transporter ATP-binding protein [Lactiplantibacillus argentoratensis]MBT1139786.1 ABC transporter ATP-binding protein [Lactiplantibacillus argentoratensi
MRTNREALLNVNDLEITFGQGKHKFTAVQDVNFNIYPGETLSLVGESGSGKTTIGRAILGINPTTKGKIEFHGKQINKPMPANEKRALTRKIQMIFQDPSASLNERATVEYIISEGLYNFHLYDSEQDRLDKVKNIIAEVGLLPEHLYRYPHEFSGGQRQRVGIARALVMRPELVVADEPISALDVSIRAQVLNLLKKFQRELGVSYLFIAHDLSVVRFVSDRIAVIHNGRILELATTQELFANPIHPYTQSLLSAIPVPDPILARQKKLTVYDAKMHHYEHSKPSFVEIKPGHFVYGNAEEIDKYRQQLQ